MGKDNIILYSSCAAGGVLIIAFFFHIMVLYLLKHVQRGATNQKLLIANLSLSEMFFIPPSTVYYFRLLWTTDGTLSSELVSVAFVSVAVNCYLANGFMIVDRTIAGLKPLRYRVILTERRVKVIAVILWVPFLFVPIPYVIYGFETFVRLMIIFTLLLDFLMIFVGISCYAFVFRAIKKRTKTFKRGDGNREIARVSARQKSKIFKVAIPIMLTFIIFVTLPDAVSLILSIKKIDAVFYRKLLYAVSCFNMLLDPILFLYQYPPLTAQFLKRIHHGRSNPMEGSSYVRSSSAVSSGRVNSGFVSSERASALERKQFNDTTL